MVVIISTIIAYYYIDMVHRDLKLENVLLSTADSDDMFNIKVRT